MTGDSPEHADVAAALARAYDTFEAIRHLARCCENVSSHHFAAFKSAASAAADGKDAILTAASRPSRTSQTAEPDQASPGVTPAEAADRIAASALRLAASLDRVSGRAGARQDRNACRGAAAAARQIHQLMAPDHDDADAR